MVDLETMVEMEKAPSRKIREWAKRYLPAEAAALGLAVAGSYLGYWATKNEVAAAYIGTMLDMVGYYSTMIGREAVADYRRIKSEGRDYNFRKQLRTVSKVVLETLPAEIVDSTITRPLALGLGTSLLDRGMGVTIGGIMASVLFYTVIIPSYELRKVILPERSDHNEHFPE